MGTETTQEKSGHLYLVNHFFVVTVFHGHKGTFEPIVPSLAFAGTIHSYMLLGTRNVSPK